MSTAVEHTLVRVLKADGPDRQQTGAGWLIAPDRLITCAHVVNYALSRDWDHPEQPDDGATVGFDLPNLEPIGPQAPPPRTARVLHWFPPDPSATPGTPADIAVLAVSNGGPIALPRLPCTLAADADADAGRIPTDGKAYGYPEGGGAGIIRDADIDGSAGGLLHVTPRTGTGIGAGFSGGPFADADGRILGMTALHNPGHGIARIIPVATLELACPALRQLRCGAVPTVTLHLRAAGETLRITGAQPADAPARSTDLARLRDRVAGGDLVALHSALFDSAADRDARLIPPPADAAARRLLRLVCADPASAALPWHALESDPGRPLAAIDPPGAWCIECVAATEPERHPHPLSQALILSPLGAELAPNATTHIAAMERALRALLPDRNAMVDKAHDPQDLDASLRHDPELIYVYARVDRAGNLELGRGRGYRQALAPKDLLERARKLALRPMLWLHCIETDGHRLDPAPLLAAAGDLPLVWVQRSETWDAPAGQALACELARRLAKSAAGDPAAALAGGGGASVLARQARPGFRLASPQDPAARQQAQIRAALIRLRLGRRQQRNQIAQETQQALDGETLLFSVGGEQATRPADLPEQIRYDLEQQGDQRSPARVVKLILPLTLAAGLAAGDNEQATDGLLQDAVGTALEQHLRLDLLPPQQALMQGEPPAGRTEQLVVLLAWHLEAGPELTAAGLYRWIGAWARAHAARFSRRDRLPQRARLLVGACVHWPAGWPAQQQTDPKALADGLTQALWDAAGTGVRTIDYLDPLDLLSPRDLGTFYRDFNRLEGSCTRGLDLDALARWTLQQAGGRFEDTVTCIYQGCRTRFDGVPGARG